jgi:hypothetical protein
MEKIGNSESIEELKKKSLKIKMFEKTLETSKLPSNCF